jgi:hypothetical protein
MARLFAAAAAALIVSRASASWWSDDKPSLRGFNETEEVGSDRVTFVQMSETEVAELEHARRLQLTSVGTVLTMGGAATAQASLGIGSTVDYSWLLVDSTLQHTFTLRDTRTTSCLFSNCPNRYTVAIGSTSPPAGYSDGAFQCPTSGTNVLCRAYNVRPGGNAAAAFNVKQAQGYGQSASWMYARITCSNSGLGAKA